MIAGPPAQPSTAGMSALMALVNPPMNVILQRVTGVPVSVVSVPQYNQDVGNPAGQQYAYGNQAGYYRWGDGRLAITRPVSTFLQQLMDAAGAKPVTLDQAVAAFALTHEAGHAKLGTQDERQADLYAANHLSQTARILGLVGKGNITDLLGLGQYGAYPTSNIPKSAYR